MTPSRPTLSSRHVKQKIDESNHSWPRAWPQAQNQTPFPKPVKKVQNRGLRPAVLKIGFRPVMTPSKTHNLIRTSATGRRYARLSQAGSSSPSLWRDLNDTRDFDCIVNKNHFRCGFNKVENLLCRHAACWQGNFDALAQERWHLETI
jgi:hypothetical protein